MSFHYQKSYGDAIWSADGTHKFYPEMGYKRINGELQKYNLLGELEPISDDIDLFPGTIIDTIEQIIPEDVIDHYDVLAELIREYFKVVELLETSNREHDINIDSVSSFTNINNGLNSNIDKDISELALFYHEILNQIRNASKDLTEKPWDDKTVYKIQSLNSKKQAIDKKIQELQKEKRISLLNEKNIRKFAGFSESNIQEIQKTLKKLVNSILEQLSKIKSLDKKEKEKRIDGLMVIPERHFVAIDKLDVSDKEKEDIKSFIGDYTDFSLYAFREYESLAGEIVSKYGNRELIDNKSEKAKFDIIQRLKHYIDYTISGKVSQLDDGVWKSISDIIGSVDKWKNGELDIHDSFNIDQLHEYSSIIMMGSSDKTKAMSEDIMTRIYNYQNSYGSYDSMEHQIHK